MPPIRSTPHSDELSDQSDGRCAQTAQRNYGSALPRGESCPRQAGLCPVGARASENPPAVPVPAWGHCRRLHRLAPAARCGEQGTGRKTLPQAVVARGRAARPRFASPRWHWLLSLRPPTAGRGPHRLRAAPCRIGRDPRGWSPSARPFFGRLLGALTQDFIPVAAPECFRALGQRSPSSPKGLQFQPEREPPLPSFVGRKARGQPPPPQSRSQDIEPGVQPLPVVVGGTPVPTPDPRRKNRLKAPPHFLGHLTGKVSQLHTPLLPLCALDPVRIRQVEGFVSQS